MSYGAAAKYMKKSFISKWVKRYSNVKNVTHDLPDCGSVQKPTKKDNRVFEKNFCLSLRGGQVILHKKRSKYIVTL